MATADEQKVAVAAAGGYALSLGLSTENRRCFFGGTFIFSLTEIITVMFFVATLNALYFIEYITR